MMSVVGTRVVAVSPEPSLVVVKVAWLDTVPQVVASVGLEMWTLKVLVSFVLTSTAGPQVYTLSLHDALPISGLTVQVRPALVGRVSEMVKPWATPAPVLVAVIV